MIPLEMFSSILRLPRQRLNPASFTRNRHLQNSSTAKQTGRSTGASTGRSTGQSTRTSPGKPTRTSAGASPSKPAQDKQRLIEWAQRDKLRVKWAKSAGWAKVSHPLASGSQHSRVPRGESERVEPEQQVELTAEEVLKYRLDNLLADCDSRSLGKFLDAIQQTPGELGPKHLEIIFDLMNQLITELDLKKTMQIDDSVLLLERSSVFATILQRSLALLHELNPDVLLSLFETLILIKRSPESEIVSRLLSALVGRLDQLNLSQLCKCYKTADQYRLLKIPETQQLIGLKNEALRREKEKLLRHQFYPSEGDAIVDHFTNFADFENDPNFEVVEYLARMLLQPLVSREMTFEQAVRIMAKVQSSYNLYRAKGNSSERPSRGRERRLYPPILGELFEQCNTRICEEFTLNPNDDETYPYLLQKLHAKVSPVNFEFSNFYDERMLSLIRPWIIWNHQNHQNNQNRQALDYSLVLRMVRNYAQFHIFDEQLMKLLYEQFCLKRSFRSFDTLNFYWLLTKFRWPFVDHQNADLLSLVYNSIEDSANCLRLLAALLLNDVNDAELLSQLNETIDQRDETIYRDLRMDDYRTIALAKSYLSLFGRLEGDLKPEIEFKLQRILQRLQATRLQAKGRYFHFDQRLTNPAYLSNGLFVDAFAIYDRSVGDLVSLYEHKDSLGRNFSKVDLLPITKQQERIAFATSNLLRGDVGQYESTYNYQLKRVLDRFGFKTVEVCLDDLTELPTQDIVKYYIRKAQDSCK